MNLLPRLFVKDYKNIEDAKVRFAYGNMCGIVGIVTNIFICIIKIVIGILVASISIIADGINNLADAGSSVLTLVGFKIASKPGDREHPFGHERMEYITGLIVALVIIGIGLLLCESSINKLISQEEMSYSKTMGIITIAILSFSILAKLWQSLFYKKYGKLINSVTLIATSRDSLNDVISTSAVLVATIVSVFYPNTFLDGIMGILVSIFIIFSGIGLVKETVSPLLGEVPSKEFITEIKNRVMSYEGVLGTHDLVIHSYGEKKIFITIHVEVNSKIDVNISHDMIDNIEADFRKDGINMVIHMDPLDIENEEIKLLREKLPEILKEIDPDLLYHDLRIVKGVTHTNVLFDLVRNWDSGLSDAEIETKVSEKLKEINDKYKVVITFDTDYTGGNI